MSLSRCPDESALWPAATGEAAADDVREHIQGCSACQAAVAVIRREINALQAECGTNRRRIPGGSNDADEDGDRAGDDLHSGDIMAIIGRYPIRRLIRCSGQAAVYLGRHPELGIDVAIKWSHAVDAIPLRCDALRQEAQLLARIRHPNLALVLDAGIADGRTFLVLEYIRGLDLRQVIATVKPNADEACRLLAGVAAAVAEVHRHGVLHLDIKPENIIVGEDGRPRLIDLGSARVFDAAVESRSATKAEGTVEYMAPERRTGDGVSERSDVYSLGAVLYELLTGEIPRIDSDWVSGAPRGAKLSRMKPSLPRNNALWRVCARTMHPDPQRRLGSAAELARLLTGRCGRRDRRRRAAFAAVIAAAAVVTMCTTIVNRVRVTRPISADSLRLAPLLELEVEDLGAEDLAAVRAECRAPDGARIAMYFVLPDGRLLPLSPIATSRNAELQVAHAPHSAQRLVLSDRSQTAMIVATLVPRSDRASPRMNVDRWTRAPLPELPEGTQLQIGSGADSPRILSAAVPAIPSAVENDLLVLDHRLRRCFASYAAVLFTPSDHQ